MLLALPSLVLLLLIVALCLTIAHAMNRAPLWPAVLIVILAMLIGSAR
jgi:hypothetical protein